jgi:hypothetical protein
MMATKDYSAIAKKKIHRPSQIQRLPKFHIYAGHKKGKTTFGMSAGVDKTLILDPENGTDPFKTKDPHVWPVNKWEDVDDFYQYAKSGDHPYEWFTVDGLSKLSSMALRYVMKVAEERNLDRQPGMVDRRDYGKSGELMRQMLTNFHNLPYGVVFTSHERMIEGDFDADEDDEDSESSSAMYVPDLPKGVRGMVNSLVDVIGRLYVVKVEIKEVEKKQRRLWIGESVKYDTGYRSDYAPLPDMLKAPTIPKLMRLIETGSTRPSA